MSPTIIQGFLAAAVLLFALLPLGIYDYRRRARLSAKERAAEDTESARGAGIW